MRADHMVLDAALAGPRLLAATQSGRVERFDWRAGRALAPLLVLSAPGEGLLPPTIRSVSVSPSGRRVAIAASDALLRLLELDPDGEAGKVREVPSGDAVASRFLGEDRVATGSLAGEVALVSFADGRTILRRHAEYAPVHALAPAPDLRRLAVAFASSAIRILGSDDLAPSAALVGHRDTVFALAWPADSVLYSGSQDKRLLAWDLRPGAPAFRELARADGYVTAVAGHAQSGQVAFATGQGRVGVIRAADGDGAVERVFEGHSAPVQVLVFADAGRRLISTGNDARVFVWDLERPRSGGSP
jgi:WD40 repeat protein